jgi:hypothetical protein
MPLLSVVGAEASALFALEASALYSQASPALPRRGRKAAHPELDAAARILKKAAVARKNVKLARCTGTTIFFPIGRQVDLVHLAIERIREDRFAPKRLAPLTIDAAFSWSPDTTEGITAVQLIP